MTLQEAVENLSRFYDEEDAGHSYIKESWQTLKSAVLSQQTNNTASPKLPPCDYCRFELKYMLILSGDTFCSHCGRQLRASA